MNTVRHLLHEAKSLGHLLLMVGMVIAGWLTGSFTGASHPEQLTWYAVAIVMCLSMGLFSAAAQVELEEARRYWKRVVLAITIGVFAKTVIIGLVAVLIFRDAKFAMMGIAFAQIDPALTSALHLTTRMSSGAKTMLDLVASCDDPVTSLFAPAVAAFVVTEIAGESVLGATLVDTSAYLSGQIWGIIFTLILLGVWLWALHTKDKRIVESVGVGVSAGAVCAPLVKPMTFITSVVIGLLVRYKLMRVFTPIVARTALVVSTFLVGLALGDGAQWGNGALLGVGVWLSQVVVGFFITVGMDWRNRVYYCIAQQNAGTAIVITLLALPLLPMAVAVAIPAIVTTNVISAIANAVMDYVTSPAESDTVA